MEEAVQMKDEKVLGDVEMTDNAMDVESLEPLSKRGNNNHSQ